MPTIIIDGNFDVDKLAYEIRSFLGSSPAEPLNPEESRTHSSDQRAFTGGAGEWRMSEMEQQHDYTSTMNREPGFYWILFCNYWQPAEWVVDVDESMMGPAWSIIGSDVPCYPDHEDITLIGPRIKLPADIQIRRGSHD